MSLLAKRTSKLKKPLFLVVAVIAICFGTNAKIVTDEEQWNNTIVSGTEPTFINSSITNYELVHKPTTGIRKIPSTSSDFHDTTEHSKVFTADGGERNTSPCNGCLPVQVDLVQKVFSSNSSNNGTHVPLTKIHSKLHVLEYVLIPIGSLLVMFLLFAGCRHWQKVQKKKRLERELIHRYSYPNSEVDEDLDYQNLPEVETVVNNQFVAYTDQSHKALLDDNLPEVAVSMGGASAKLVLHETPSAHDGAGHSANFNC